jgi:hypothetical protein
VRRRCKLSGRIRESEGPKSLADVLISANTVP